MTHDEHTSPAPTVVDPPVETTTWRALFDEAGDRLEAVGADSPRVDARRIVEEAAGSEPGEFVLVLDQAPMKRGVARFDSMLERRLVGEPLQYVLGRWGFRRLDLAIDARVLIPRPETEEVAGLALAELERQTTRERAPLAADLGTGSGCIGLSLVIEHTTVSVICTDQSRDAIAAARANLAGLGRPATRVEIRQGDWFEALPSRHRGEFNVIVANPPYIAADEALPKVVADWEPIDALIAGPTGLEHAAVLISGAREWLCDGGALVLELGASQLGEAADLARSHGYSDVVVHRDLAGRDRALVAR